MRTAMKKILLLYVVISFSVLAMEYEYMTELTVEQKVVETPAERLKKEGLWRIMNKRIEGVLVQLLYNESARSFYLEQNEAVEINLAKLTNEFKLYYSYRKDDQDYSEEFGFTQQRLQEVKDFYPEYVIQPPQKSFNVLIQHLAQRLQTYENK